MPILSTDLPAPAAPACLTSQLIWSRRKRPVWTVPEPARDEIRHQLGLDQLAGLTRIEAFEEHLTRVLNTGACVFFSGREFRALAGQAPAQPLRDLRLVVDPDGRGIPRFHVLGPGVDASFALADGRLLAGGSDRRRTDLIRCWYLHAKPHLPRVWSGAGSAPPSASRTDVA